MELFHRTVTPVLILIHIVAGNWWNLASIQQPPQSNNSLEQFSLSHRESCHRLPYLVERQKQLCLLSDRILQILQGGARQSLEECQHQFRHSRWNCSTSAQENATSIFGGVLDYNSRESAFVHALSAAALAHAVARACSRGELNECSCDSRVRRRTPRHWQWGGCSEDIKYGEMFSRDFADSKEDKSTDEGLMNLHNNEAGRRAVRGRMQRVCKCHGMSGSCSVRVCWRRLPLLRAVGDVLAQRYEGASHVKVVERKKGRNLKKLRPLHPEMKKPNKTDLVYLEDSPDYCETDEDECVSRRNKLSSGHQLRRVSPRSRPPSPGSPELDDVRSAANETGQSEYPVGILGTRGRLCNRTSAGLDGCRLLCCGRGYQTRVRDHEDKCKCRFVWCCQVKCEVCRSKKEEHVCN